jgi:hypothetical protein
VASRVGTEIEWGGSHFLVFHFNVVPHRLRLLLLLAVSLPLISGGKRNVATTNGPRSSVGYGDSQTIEPFAVFFFFRKDHALKGNQLTLFMMEVIHEALQEIETKGSDPNALLVELQKQEDDDYKQFKEADLPDLVDKALPKVDDVPVEILFKEPNMCHTARLPAEARFKGILTESDQTGFESYDKGTAMNEVASTQNPGGKMRLTYDPAARSGCVAEKDFKDFYYISQKHEGVSTIFLPNAREKAEYGTPGKPLRGIVSICFAACRYVSWSGLLMCFYAQRTVV